jgi:putative transcriptional regulator
MVKSLIEWRLHVVMAEKRVTPSDLAERTGFNRVSISRLKNSLTMPRLNEETLDKLCTALGCQPGDLIRYIPDSESTK